MFNFIKRFFGVADVNKDGKIDSADAKVVVQAVEAGAKTGAAKVRSQVKKAAVKAKTARNKRTRPAA